MTRSGQDGWSPEAAGLFARTGRGAGEPKVKQGTSPIPGQVEVSRDPWVVTVAEDGPRRTTLDVVAARCTCVTGEPLSIDAFVAKALRELAVPPEVVGRMLLVVDPATTTFSDAIDRQGLGSTTATTRVQVATTADAIAGLDRWASASPSRRTVVVVGRRAMEDPDGVAALVAVTLGREDTGLLLGGPGRGPSSVSRRPRAGHGQVGPLESPRLTRLCRSRSPSSVRSPSPVSRGTSTGTRS